MTSSDATCWPRASNAQRLTWPHLVQLQMAQEAYTPQESQVKTHQTAQTHTKAAEQKQTQYIYSLMRLVWNMSVDFC